jgi:hypothetical protein
MERREGGAVLIWWHCALKHLFEPVEHKLSSKLSLLAMATLASVSASP